MKSSNHLDDNQNIHNKSCFACLVDNFTASFARCHFIFLAFFPLFRYLLAVVGTIHWISIVSFHNNSILSFRLCVFSLPFWKIIRLIHDERCFFFIFYRRQSMTLTTKWKITTTSCRLNNILQSNESRESSEWQVNGVDVNAMQLLFSILMVDKSIMLIQKAGMLCVSGFLPLHLEIFSFI